MKEYQESGVSDKRTVLRGVRACSLSKLVYICLMSYVWCACAYLWHTACIQKIEVVCTLCIIVYQCISYERAL